MQTEQGVGEQLAQDKQGQVKGLEMAKRLARAPQRDKHDVHSMAGQQSLTAVVGLQKAQHRLDLGIILWSKIDGASDGDDSGYEDKAEN